MSEVNQAMRVVLKGHTVTMDNCFYLVSAGGGAKEKEDDPDGHLKKK